MNNAQHNLSPVQIEPSSTGQSPRQRRLAVWGCNLGTFEKFVLLALLEHEDYEKLISTTGVKKLAEMVSMTENGVSNFLKRLTEQGILETIQASKGRITTTRRVVIAALGTAELAQSSPGRAGVEAVVTPQQSWGQGGSASIGSTPNGKCATPNGRAATPNAIAVAPNGVGPFLPVFSDSSLPPLHRTREDDPNAVGVRKSGGSGGGDSKPSNRKAAAGKTEISGDAGARPAAGEPDGTGWLCRQLKAAGAYGADVEAAAARQDFDAELVAYLEHRAATIPPKPTVDGVGETTVAKANRRAGLLRKLIATPRDDLNGWATPITRRRQNRMAAVKQLHAWLHGAGVDRAETDLYRQHIEAAVGGPASIDSYARLVPLTDEELWPACREQECPRVWKALIAAIKAGRVSP